MSIFMVNKLPSEEFKSWFDKRKEEVKKERERQRIKSRKEKKNTANISEYDYDLNVRRYIDSRLSKIDSIRANRIEFNPDSYRDEFKKSKAKKENRIAQKEIKALEEEIKKKDPFFYAFIRQG